jgi:hypothetical protein
MPDQSPTPLGDVLDSLAKDDQFAATVKGDQAGVTVTASGTKELGKGWSIGGAVQWSKDQWAAWAGVIWSPGKKP